MTAAPNDDQRGVLYGVGAYVLWGLFPLYFKALQARPLEVLMHRVLWSSLLLGLVLSLARRWAWLGRARREPRILLGSFASACLLALNWFVYIWAVTRGRVVDASLGYFINPLVSVLLGVGLLAERLRRAQWVAIGLAALGVAWLWLLFGEVPWVGLVLAATFGSYGALRKTAALGSLEGLTLEALLLLPLSSFGLWWLGDEGSFATGNALERLLLVLSGPFTVVPLLLFAASARRVPLSLVGLLQYIAPTLQLALGVWLFGEPFGLVRLVGYALIWAALGVYAADGIRRARRARAPASA